MLENLLSVVKEVAEASVRNNADIPSDKKSMTASTASDAIIKSLAGNAGGLKDLLSGSGSSNDLISSISESVIGALVKKVGLDSGVAGSLVSSMLPIVVKELTSKVGSGGSGFNVESILSALTGEDKKGGMGDLLGTVGKLFGK